MGFKIKNGVLLKYEAAGALERLGIRKQDEAITIPKSVTEIADEAFTMTEINSISIPASVKSIGERAFALCAQLQDVEFSDGLREIGTNAFDGCHVLRAANLPETCETIGAWAFCNCSGLRSVFISDQIEAIARGTFSGCSRLEDVTLPPSVKHIDNRAFYACTSLINLKLTAGLRTIGREAFACCSSLTSVYIPETVTEIGEDAFAGCTELKSIIIPPSVTKLHPYAFGSDHNIQVITTVTGSAAHRYAQEHGIMCYTEREANLLRGCNPAFFIEYGILKKYTQEYNVRDIMIPDGVIRIGNHAFEQNRQLVSVVVPEGVVEIGGYAFNGCRSLQRIYLPSTLKRIGRFAFRDCPLIEVILPQGMEMFLLASPVICQKHVTVLQISNVLGIEREGSVYAFLIVSQKTFITVKCDFAQGVFAFEHMQPAAVDLIALKNTLIAHAVSVTADRAEKSGKDSLARGMDRGVQRSAADKGFSALQVGVIVDAAGTETTEFFHSSYYS